MAMAESLPWAKLLWAAIGLGLVIYAVTGGADLGAGLWSLLSSGPRKEEQRRAVRSAIAPIWEANHVWLIFVIVVLFSAFSRAFAAISIALHVPIALGLLGIVFRGSAYTFGAYGIQSDAARSGWERVFAWASLITPVCFGSVAGAMGSGAIRVVQGQVVSGYFAGFTSAFALSTGVLALALFALLAAAYLAAETSGPLQSDFIARALVMEIVSGAAAAGTFVLARSQAPLLYENLAHSSWTWPVQIATALCALLTCALLVKRRSALARYTAAAQIALVVIGWGAAMDGHFLVPDLNFRNATTNPEVLPALALALLAGGSVLAPSLYYLFWIFKQPKSSENPDSKDAH
jgi:cytochrome d ubiquinol oxidase subunit II